MVLNFYFNEYFESSSISSLIYKQKEMKVMHCFPLFYETYNFDTKTNFKPKKMSLTSPKKKIQLIKNSLNISRSTKCYEMVHNDQWQCNLPYH